MVPGEQLRQGWAVSPDGERQRHYWLLRNGYILDLQGYTDHEDLGRASVDKYEYSELTGTDYWEYDEARREAGIVQCDDASCAAKLEPENEEDYREAYEHWRNHGWIYGCSHGR